MKTFLITISILGAIVYGMLQINEHYDNKGACSWGLFDGGGEYRHKERLDNAIAGIMSYCISQDKKARSTLLKQQGKSQAEIDKVLKSLAPQYKKETEKMEKYCYLDFEKEPYFQKKSMRVKPSSYCEISNGNNYDDNGYTGFRVEYNFDKESHKFFNKIDHASKTKADGWEMFVFDGIEYVDASSPCEIRFRGIREGSTVLVTYKNKIDKIDKTKYVDIKF